MARGFWRFPSAWPRYPRRAEPALRPCRAPDRSRGRAKKKPDAHSLINSVYGELRDLAQTDHTPFTAEQLEQLKRYLLHQVTTIDPSELSPIDEDTEEE